jgi:penicillin-binding protein 1C
MDRLNGKLLWNSPTGQPRMAWKTGTSYGHRDAWTVAYTPEYTIGVWMGNFAGKRARGLVGMDAAAPVAARIMSLIYRENASTWYPLPACVGIRPICAASGMALGGNCKNRASDYFLRGISSAQPCSVHVAIRVDMETGCRLYGSCPPGRACTERVVEIWPSGLAFWFSRHERYSAQVPPDFPGCALVGDRAPNPCILSPASRQAYVFQENAPLPQNLLLKAASASERVYWFIDGALYKDCPPDEQTFWPLQRGVHKVVCSDEFSRSASVVIDVR